MAVSSMGMRGGKEESLESLRRKSSVGILPIIQRRGQEECGHLFLQSFLQRDCLFVYCRVRAHLCACALRGQKRAWGVLYHYPSAYSFEAGPFLEPGVRVFSAGLQPPRVLSNDLPT